MKNKRNTLNILLLFFVMWMLSGCAGTPMEIKLTDSNVSINFAIEPYESLGLKVTDSIESGDITIRQGVFPPILRGEYGPARIRWNGLTIQEDGREFFTQYLLSVPNFSGYMTWTIVIDGRPNKNASTMVLSSLMDYAYDAFGEEFGLTRDDFSDDADYRLKFISENGTPLSSLREVNIRDFLESIRNWNMLNTDKGGILTPISKEGIKEISQINPQYTDWEKRLSESHVSVFYADPVAIVAYNAIEVFRTENKLKNGGVKSIGWDYNSEMPNRRAMALTIKCFEEMKKSLMKNMLAEKNAFLTQGGQ